MTYIYALLLRDAVCKCYGHSLATLLSKKRSARIVHARQILMYLLHRGGWSYTDVGMFLKRHHSTCMHGVKQIKYQLTINDAVRNEIDGILLEALR
jgi:chromosomal replication initiation ATPase DnaA